MIAIQGFKNSKNSVYLLVDNKGIDEMIEYLNFIKHKDSSIHLNEGNELSSTVEDIEEEMYLIPHIKIINLDKID